MVLVQQFGVSARQWVIRPDRSLSWREAGWCYVGMAVPVLGVGIGGYLLGIPFILPFSGLETSVLGAAFYLCVARGRRQEVVSVDEHSVLIERGVSRATESYCFNRFWVQVVLERSRIGYYPSRLKLRSHGREVEVGVFLTEAERLRLARELRAACAHPASCSNALPGVTA